MTVSQRTIAELVTSDIAQTGANGPDEFDYVDISSVDNRTKRIEAPKRLAASDAPSRARQLLRVNDVLVSMTRPNLNAVALVPPSLDGAIGSTGFHVLRAEQNTEPAWLFYAVQSPQFVHAMSELVQGALYPAVRPKDIRSFALLVPSRAVQQEIVTYLDEQLSRLDASVAALRRVQANLKRYRASVLKSACEGRLVPTEAELARQEGRDFESGALLMQRILVERRLNWPAKGSYAAPGLPALPSQASLPQGWAWTSIGQLISERLCNGLSIKGTDSPPGVRALKLNAITSEGFDYTQLRYLPVDEQTVSDILIRPGDYFVSRGNGSLELVGRGTLAQVPPHPVIFPDTMIRLRFAPQVKKSQWIRLIWESRWVRGQIEGKVKTTAGIYKISQPELESIVVPLPPLAEQQRIVAEADRRLSLIRVAEAQVAANIARAQRLRKAILQAAFATPA